MLPEVDPHPLWRRERSFVTGEDVVGK